MSPTGQKIASLNFNCPFIVSKARIGSLGHKTRRHIFHGKEDALGIQRMRDGTCVTVGEGTERWIMTGREKSKRDLQSGLQIILPLET